MPGWTDANSNTSPRTTRTRSWAKAMGINLVPRPTLAPSAAWLRPKGEPTVAPTFWRWVLALRLHRIADVDRASDQHAGRHPAMSAHGRIPTWSDGVFHARTRLARADDFQQRSAHLQLGILQRKQVDAGDHEVAAQADWIDGVDTRQTCNHRQVFSLDERDLARGQFRSATLAQPVIGESYARKCHGSSDRSRAFSRRTSDDDGLDPPLDLGWPVEIADGLHARRGALDDLGVIASPARARAGRRSRPR